MSSIFVNKSLLWLILLGGGCVGCVKMEHEVKPIHITVDVNLKIVQQELNNFFGELDAASSTREPPPTDAH